MELLVWEIEHEGSVARVCEDGSVECGDESLARRLRGLLTEPVTVYRHGTVHSNQGAPRVPIDLHPGDGRYVVARVRALCAAQPEFRVVGADWREPSA